MSRARPLRCASMKALRSFTVRPSLPPSWPRWRSWRSTSAGRGTTRPVTCSAGSTPTCGTPASTTRCACWAWCSRERLDALAADAGFRRFLGEVRDELQRYLDGERWFQARGEQPAATGRLLLARVRHRRGRCPSTRAASASWPATTSRRRSDLGVPLVGVGLLYRHGYFRQSLNADGWQQERYPLLDPHAMALTRSTTCAISVDLAGAPLVAQVWRADVGRVPLYLLDADVDENTDDAAPGHRPPLRRRHRAPPAPGDPARHGRRAGPAGRRRRRPGVPHQRGPRRLPRARAHPPAGHRPGPELPRGHRGGAGRLHLHHPHPGPGRHRPVPPRADGEVLRRLVPRRAASRSTT